MLICTTGRETLAPINRKSKKHQSGCSLVNSFDNTATMHHNFETVRQQYVILAILSYASINNNMKSSVLLSSFLISVYWVLILNST